MDQERFKTQLQRDKLWLQELCRSDNVPKRRRILYFASDKKLDTLIMFLYFVSNGQIKIAKHHFDNMEQGHLKHIKKCFEKKAAVLRLLKSERENKIKSISRLLQVLPFLLSTLFKDPQ